MINIRRHVFETNSSSCHTITLARRSVFDKLRSHKFIYTGEIEHHDDYREYYTEIDEELIKPIERVVEDIKEVIDSNRFNTREFCYSDELKEKFYNLYNSKASEDEFYDFLMSERYLFEDFLHYSLTDTDYVLALNKDLSKETSTENDSWLEDEFVKTVSKDDDDIIIRKAKVLC